MMIVFDFLLIAKKSHTKNSPQFYIFCHRQGHVHLPQNFSHGYFYNWQSVLLKAFHVSTHPAQECCNNYV